MLILSRSVTAGTNVPLAATRIYQMSFFTGFGVSALLYYVLNRIFPVQGMYADFKEEDLSNFVYRHSADVETNSTSSDSDSSSSGKDKKVSQVVYEAEAAR